MQKMTIKDILAATDGTLLSGDENTVITDVITNSRKADEGMLFIPIIGDKFDGHEFIKAAFDMGAAAALTQKETELFIGKTIVRVSDTRRALGDIAKYYKQKYNVPSVAVTGSVGKTTTKDMIASVLSQKYRTLKTQKNYNNDIGVPDTIFNLEKEHEAAVIEMGMNHFGEIEYLAEIGRPDIAVITNIGESHIANLGSQEGIFKAKMEITKLFTSENTLIVNGDDKFLSKTKGMGDYKVVYYGMDNPENDVRAKNIMTTGQHGIKFTAVIPDGEYEVRVNVPGEHNVYNALAAVCAGLEMNISMPDIVRGIENVELTSERLDIEDYNGITIINDCYNASPDSVKAAVKVLCEENAERKIALLGDILEMGDYAEKAHYELGRFIAESGIDILITAGNNMKHLARGAQDGGMSGVKAFGRTLEVCEYIKDKLKQGDAVLVKASHGMNFSEVYKAIKNN